MDTPKELNDIVLPQTVVGPLTRAAIFLVVCIRPDVSAYASVRSFCADLAGLVRAVEFRDVEARLTCVAGFGSDVWDTLFGDPRPVELHPFREIHSGGRHAVSTPGDILFHIRAKRPDLCFELAAQIMESLGDAATVADEVHGFRYFDDRDVLGFVDGTENPRGDAARDAALVGAEDPAFAGGSYVIVQKYLHDIKGWNALSVETQERIVGRKKLSDIELNDVEKPAFAHNALTAIEENGVQLQILRDNMPFGRPGHGEFGTYFIGYSRTPRITELMLQNMFVGNPPGNYDRLLDFNHPVTGTLFFAPSSTFLDTISGEAPKPAVVAASPAPSVRETPAGTLAIGSLKGMTADRFIDDFACFIRDYAASGAAIALLCVEGSSTSVVPIEPSICKVWDERSLTLFYRDIFKIENIPEERFFEVAGLAFPNLCFCLEHTRFNRFGHQYSITRPLVVEHLKALNDYFRIQVAACQGNPSEIKEYFSAAHKVDLSPESTKTRGSAKLMAERRVEIEGVEYICEWHTKLFPTEDRIHFNFEANLQLRGRILIGIFAKHLST